MANCVLHALGSSVVFLSFFRFFYLFFYHSFFQFSLSPRYISLFAVFFCRLNYTVTILCRVLNLPVSKNGILLNLPLIQFFFCLIVYISNTIIDWHIWIIRQNHPWWITIVALNGERTEMIYAEESSNWYSLTYHVLNFVHVNIVKTRLVPHVLRVRMLLHPFLYQISAIVSSSFFARVLRVCLIFMHELSASTTKDNFYSISISVFNELKSLWYNLACYYLSPAQRVGRGGGGGWKNQSLLNKTGEL